MITKEKINEIIGFLPTPNVGTYLSDGFYNTNLLSMFDDIKRIINPNTIFEIGTHCGYSSLAFLSYLDTSYLISIDIDGHSIEKNKLDIVNNILTKYFPDIFCSYVISSFEHDSILKLLNNRKIDLIHIDGDHTYNGVIRDLELSKKIQTKYVLVDDFTTSDNIRLAVKDSNIDIIKIYDNIHSNVGAALCEIKYE